MNQNEELSNSYNRLKNATKTFCGATDKVLTDIGNEENQEVVSNKKEVIERALCKEFTMAYSSIFLQKLMNNQIYLKV